MEDKRATSEPDEKKIPATRLETEEITLWDKLLAKYVRVWIWSLLFGATSGLSYSYIGIRFDRPWGPLAALPLAILVVGVAATVGAWLSLLTHLRLTILRTFFGYWSRSEYEDDPKFQEWREKRSSASIIKAYQYLFLAGIARLALAMSDLVFEVLRYRSF